jgi:hypothetical protein
MMSMLLLLLLAFAFVFASWWMIVRPRGVFLLQASFIAMDIYFLIANFIA